MTTHADTAQAAERVRAVAELLAEAQTKRERARLMADDDSYGLKVDAEHDEDAALARLQLKDLRQLLSFYDARQWRPISEAPRDGSYILIASETHATDVHVVRWTDDSYGESGWIGWSDYGPTPELQDATHFMPLPPPPGPPEEQEAK